MKVTDIHMLYVHVQYIKATDVLCRVDSALAEHPLIIFIWKWQFSSLFQPKMSVSWRTYVGHPYICRLHKFWCTVHLYSIVRYWVSFTKYGVTLFLMYKCLNYIYTFEKPIHLHNYVHFFWKSGQTPEMNKCISSSRIFLSYWTRRKM